MKILHAQRGMGIKSKHKRTKITLTSVLSHTKLSMRREVSYSSPEAKRKAYIYLFSWGEKYLNMSSR